MSSSRLEQIVHHDGRLNLLSCLLDNEPLSASQLAARVDDSVQAVRYWLRLLDTFDLVKEHDMPAAGEIRYALTLDGQPDWVRKAIEGHRPGAL